MIVNEDYFQNDGIICKIYKIRRNVKSNRSQFGFILILIAFVISITFCFNPEALLKGGYDLAMDGLVVARTLMNLLVKIGDLIINKKDW